MRLGLKPKKLRVPINIASQPGYVAAVSIALGIDQKPRLLNVMVEFSTSTAIDKLDLISRSLRFNRETIRLILEPGEYQFLQIELPAVPAEELKTACKWQIKDLLRFPAEQATLDILTTPSDHGTGNRKQTGFAVAAPNDIILDRMLRFRNTRSTLAVIDIPELAQRNIANVIEEPGRATAVLSLSESGSLYTVSRDGILYFTRTFDISLVALNSHPETRRGLFDRLALELQRSMDVLERQFSFLSISTLWIAPFEHRDELLSLLIETLYLPVKAIELDQLVDCSECAIPSEAMAQAALFLPLGLALRPWDAL